jgi:hypothetical protein
MLASKLGACLFVVPKILIKFVNLLRHQCFIYFCYGEHRDPIAHIEEQTCTARVLHALVHFTWV